jgi:hypothetical protein
VTRRIARAGAILAAACALMAVGPAPDQVADPGPDSAQSAATTENLVFTSVSNVLKTRHDTAKNSISNIR